MSRRRGPPDTSGPRSKAWVGGAPSLLSQALAAACTADKPKQDKIFVSSSSSASSYRRVLFNNYNNNYNKRRPSRSRSRSPNIYSSSSTLWRHIHATEKQREESDYYHKRTFSRGPHEGGPHEGGPHEWGPHEGGPHEGGPHEGGPHEGGPHEGGPHRRGAPRYGEAAHRHVKMWITEASSAAASRGPRSFLGGPYDTLPGSPYRQGKGGLRRQDKDDKDDKDDEHLWLNDLYTDDIKNVSSAVFIRGLPPDITQQEILANFSRCGNIVGVKMDARGRVVTAEVSYREKAAAAFAAKTFNGVYIQPKKIRDNKEGLDEVPIHLKHQQTPTRLKVSVVDKTQQPSGVQQIEESDIPLDMPSRLVLLRNRTIIKTNLRGPPGGPRGPPGRSRGSGMVCDAEPVSIFDRLS